MDYYVNESMQGHRVADEDLMMVLQVRVKSKMLNLFVAFFFLLKSYMSNLIMKSCPLKT